MSEKSILIVDDDKSLGRSIKLNLDGAGFSTQVVEDVESAFGCLSNNNFDVVLCDQLLPGADGLSFVKKCNLLYPQSAVILMTGYGDRELAVAALKAGAYDYLTKPFPIDELLLTLQKIASSKNLEKENQALKSEITKIYSLGSMVGHSESLHKVFDTARRVAAFNSTVLITGESGTGKELLARGIHELSARAKKPFIAVNCGAIPENLMESEFFGHKKGAFTDAYSDRNGLFEEANGGTIFLDEIGEMPLHLQVKLLRVLQEQQIQRIGDDRPRPISVRVIAATLRNLQDDVRTGRFREDLYYRLNVINLAIPALRERLEDLPFLVQHFVDKYNQKLATKINHVTPALLQKLAEHSWPGNVRELENAIERAMVLSDSTELDVDALPSSFITKVLPDKQPNQTEQQTTPVKFGPQELSLNIPVEVQKLERHLIALALQKTKGNRSQASEVLGISLRTLMYKIKTYNLT